MKKFMISLAIASIAMFSFAQETVSEVVVPTKSHSQGRHADRRR